MSPLLALYGYHPPSIISSLKVSPRVQAIEDHLLHQQKVLLVLKENLAMAQNWMKQQEDQHHSERNFEVWDWVFLRLQPYKKISMKQQKMNNKLSPRYYGAYQIMQKIGSVSYKLELPPTTKIHPVFHVSCLKKVIGWNICTQTILPKLDEEGRIILEPKCILQTHTKKLRYRTLA